MYSIDIKVGSFSTKLSVVFIISLFIQGEKYIYFVKILLAL